MALSFSVAATSFMGPTAMMRTNVRTSGPCMAEATLDDNAFCFGLPGNMGPAGDFDPAGFLEGTEKGEVLRWREAELTHGRVSMLASLGFLVQEKFHPLFSADGGPAIEQIPKLPVGLWFVMTLGITFCEVLRIQAGWANPYDLSSTGVGGATGMLNIGRLKDNYYPGSIGFDPLNLAPEDPAEFRLMQEKELAHCRLAMIAAAGFLAQEAVSGDTWGTYWGNPSL